MPSIWDLIPVSSVPVQSFTWPPDPLQLFGGRQDTPPRRNASMPTSPPFGWAPASNDPASSPTYSGGILGALTGVDVADPARTARLDEDHARRAYEFALWLSGPGSRGAARPTRELAANPGPSINTPAVPVTAGAVAPPQRAGTQASPGATGTRASQHKYWLAAHGIDTGPAPMDRNEALARTANTRRLASEGWEAGYGDQPIIPYRWARTDDGVPAPNRFTGHLWNLGSTLNWAADKAVRGARGAYLGAIGGAAGIAGDLGLESHPDELARAIPEGINVLGAVTMQPELRMLPRFPVSAAVRFAAKHPGEAIAGVAEPYLFNRPMDWAMKNVVPEGAGIFGGRLSRTADLSALARAEKMEAAGLDTRNIRRETGWGRGADGQWKYEIPDESSRMIAPVKAGDQPVALETRFEHPDFAKAYPDDWNAVKVAPLPEDVLARRPDLAGKYNAETRTIYLNPNMVPEKQRLNVLHELQHVVQKREGFAPGGSPKMLEVIAAAKAEIDKQNAELIKQRDGLFAQRDRYIKEQQAARPDADATRLEQEFWKQNRELQNTWGNINHELENTQERIKKASVAQYNRLAGEVEAENVVKRADWDDAERRIRPPEDTAIPYSEQLVLPPR
jgi:Large polyvalent protein associated domain 23/IrrE N-terminal-like domain